MAGGSIISASPAGSRGGAAAPFGGLGGGPYPPRLIAAPEIPPMPGGTGINPLGGTGNDGGGGGIPPGGAAGGGFTFPAPTLNTDDKRPRPRFGVGPSREPWKPDIYMPGKPIGKQQIVDPGRPRPAPTPEPNPTYTPKSQPLAPPTPPRAPGLMGADQPMQPTIGPQPRPMGPPRPSATPTPTPRPMGPPRPAMNPYPTKPTFQSQPTYGQFRPRPGQATGGVQEYEGGNVPGMYQPPPLQLMPPPPPSSPDGGGGFGPPPGGPGGPGGGDAAPGAPSGGSGGTPDDPGGGGGGGPAFGVLPRLTPRSSAEEIQAWHEQRNLLDTMRKTLMKRDGNPYGGVPTAQSLLRSRGSFG